jgi:prepilin-type N-terminal cleavage/methylation domain-containing protein
LFLLHRLLKTEAGYSLMEVVVAIIILAIAILPMVGMFDMGINSATKGGQYDKARALANLKMEEAKSLPYTTVRDNFPPGQQTPYTTETWIFDPPDFAGFRYRVEKQFMTAPAQDQYDAFPNPFTFEPSGSNTGLIRVKVIVQWGDDWENEYTTYVLVGSGQ